EHGRSPAVDAKRGRALSPGRPQVADRDAYPPDPFALRVVVLTQTEGAKEARFLPLAANIRTILKGILEDRDPADSVLVAFAGHGVQFRGSEESYFCAMDARLTDRKSLISFAEVYREMEKSKAGAKLLLVDACRNDPQADHSRARA